MKTIDSAKISQQHISPDEFLTTKELMQLLKIRHRQTVYDLIKEGMPVIALGRNYRYIKDEVIDFLKYRSKIARPIT